jgi:APA family basic amino acid/polyamine antiporter
MIVIGLVIGLGIFRTPADAASAAVSPAVYFGAWIAGGIIAFCGGLTFAEIGSRYPVTGGFYRIFSYAYHPSIAFAINCVILISNASALAGVALIGSEYISQVIFKSEPSSLVKSMLSIGAIVGFYGINMLGLRISTRVLNFLMLIKLGMIAMIVAAIFMPHLYHPGNHFFFRGSSANIQLLLSFGIAMKAASFTYGGYQQTINFGEEIENPRKNIPRGVFWGIMVIILLYLSVSLSYYLLIGFQDLKGAKGIASIVAEKMFGITGKNIASVLLFVAVLAYVNVMLLSNPRVMFAMSEDGMLPVSFKKKDQKRDVLTVSLTVFAAICVVVLFFADTFEKILSFSIFLDSIGMATSAATIFIFRKRTKHLDNTGIYTMKYYPWIPLIFVITYVFVWVTIGISFPKYALIGTIVFLSFLLIYFLAKRFMKKREKV